MKLKLFTIPIGRKDHCSIVLYSESISSTLKQMKENKSWPSRSSLMIKAVLLKRSRKSSGKCFRRMTTSYKYWTIQLRSKSHSVQPNIFWGSSWSVLRRVSNSSLCKGRSFIWKVKTIPTLMRSSTMPKRLRTWLICCIIWLRQMGFYRRKGFLIRISILSPFS